MTTLHRFCVYITASLDVLYFAGLARPTKLPESALPLKLFTNEILKISEKSNLIRSQRPKWRQSNRKGKINYATVEP